MSLVLFFAFELAIACPVYQIVQHVEIIGLFSDNCLEDHDHDESDICAFCFNKNSTLLSTGNDHLFSEPESEFKFTYFVFEKETSKLFFHIRPPPKFLS